jgi:hypothetical protein
MRCRDLKLKYCATMQADRFRAAQTNRTTFHVPLYTLFTRQKCQTFTQLMDHTFHCESFVLLRNFYGNKKSTKPRQMNAKITEKSRLHSILRIKVQHFQHLKKTRTRTYHHQRPCG